MAGTANSGRRKDKPFRDAIMFALSKIEKLEDGTEHKRLDLLAEATVKKALTGDVPAIKEIADRVDGKVPQGVIGGDDDDPAIKMVNEIRRTIVDPKPDTGNPDSTDIQATPGPGQT